MAVLLLPASFAAAENKRQNRLFMREFALFVQDKLDREQRTKDMAKALISENRVKVKDGFGIHPELIVALLRETGIERLNCISGRYYETLLSGLNNEERHAFYGIAEELNWWLVMTAEEEADEMGVKKVSPPFSFRRRLDVPYYIKQDITDALRPYLEERPGPDEKGLEFNGLECNG